MYNLLDVAAMRLRAQLAADAHMADLRVLSVKRRSRRVWHLIAAIRVLTILGVAPVRVAALRNRARLANDAYFAHLRRRIATPRTPRGLAALQWVAVVVMFGAFVLAGVAPFAVTASACDAEDSTRAAIGTDVAGCIWWGSLQGNGRGDTVWNRPNG